MKRIGEILIENGAITTEQLKKALERQKNESGKLLGKILIEIGYVTEEDIVIAMAVQLDIPYLPISNLTLNQAVAKLIPEELIQKHLCLAVDRIDNLLTVVMADPTNEKAIQEIQAATKCKVQAFVATATEISEVIQKRFRINVLSKPELGAGLSQVAHKA